MERFLDFVDYLDDNHAPFVTVVFLLLSTLSVGLGFVYLALITNYWSIAVILALIVAWYLKEYGNFQEQKREEGRRT